MRKINFFAVLFLCSFPLHFLQADTHITPQLSQNPLQILAQNIFLEHPSLQSSQAQYNAVLAQTRAAGQPLYNPEIEIDIENSTAKTSSLGLNQRIDWSDKQGAQIDAGKARANAAFAQLKQDQVEFFSAFLNQISLYYTTKAQSELALQRVDLLSSFYQLAKRRFNAGDVGLSDVDLAQMALSEAQMKSASATSNAYASNSQMLSFSTLPKNGWPILPTLPKPWQQINNPKLLNNLPLIQQRLWEFKANQANQTLARRQAHADPTIGLRSGKEDKDALLGFNFSMPLNIRNNFSAEIEAAAALSISAEQAWLQSRRLAEAALSSASQRYKLTHQALHNWHASGLSSLQSQVKLLKRLWESGELSTTEYLVQLQQTLNTRSSAIDLQQSAWLAWIDWLKAAGQTHHWLTLNHASAE